MTGGDFTQMGKVFGQGGGIQRVVDTNVKRMPAGGAATFNPEGGVSLQSLGIGGPDAASIIRQSIRLQPTSDGQYVDTGLVGSNSNR